MEFTSLRMEMFLMVVEIFGDPIGLLYVLLKKIECWNHWASVYHQEGGPDLESNNPDRSFALVMATINEFVPSSHVNYDHYQYPICSCSARRLNILYRQSAVTILDSKTHGTGRTSFSVTLYIFGLVSAFFPALGGSISPSGGQIAPAILLQWLLPTIVSSNVVGKFKSSRDPLQAILTLKERIEELDHTERCSGYHPEWMRYLDNPKYLELHLSARAGSSINNDLRQDYGTGDSCKAHQSIPVLLIIVSITPLAISFIAAFKILYSAPTYLTCRHFMLIGDLAAWLSSPIITWWIAKSNHLTESKRHNLILAKNLFISTCVLTLLITSSCGLFNNCYCWSGATTPGREPAVVLDRAGFKMMRMGEGERNAALTQRSLQLRKNRTLKEAQMKHEVQEFISQFERWDESSCIV